MSKGSKEKEGKGRKRKEEQLNGVQAHGVKQTVGEVTDAVHERHGPKHGGGHGVQLPTRRHHLDQRTDHVQDERQSGHDHEPVKPSAVLAVGERGKPAAHGVGGIQLHNGSVHGLCMGYVWFITFVQKIKKK